MAAKDGDGWALCRRGHRHWGVHGASGLLAVHFDAVGTPHVLMQKRALWSHHGGTWGLPGGALDSHEDAVTGAMREALEEAALQADVLRVAGVYTDDHGGWTFQTVIAEADALFPASPANDESTDLRWLPADEVGDGGDVTLHPGFAETWPVIRRTLPPSTVVLDAANILGAAAEHGWWRDRAGATRRLLGRIEELAKRGLTPPDGFPAPARWHPRMIMVVEGQARGVRSDGPVTTVPAPGSGDDTIVDTVREIRGTRPWERVLVVTADRELRRRVTGLGAEVTGPRWLLGQVRPR
ncbi:NTP pyrophosphohydrolase [Sphaerisporangium siamense]|uniref:8-oxo-dGTP pyrophosphatase MutT (NUDIX family) n=1 Tax=Sphaerisporangium siamense TaxID=795645 RepID=A0A7W7G6Y1_9ACTN|nr:NUDIX hydrolase [Sphaerisporangium siamense]MBB4700028.1 8-oxo-dGTP pyrophosphatase MutT (NUDIX family) [Sphaerisporangium siamense]GII84654.1 NTP pyrophosphohydrolase [Sphaerisporangium siamense]